MDVLNEAKKVFDYVVDARRRIHQTPELGFEEHGTTAYVAARLNELGVPYKLMQPTGVLGEIRGAFSGNTVLLRADMDALPIEEHTGLPFASVNPGISHACGHDGHTAMLLGAARLLNENRQQLHGTVKLMFQPAEETGNGAERMIEQGVLEGVDVCFAEHILSQLPVGTIMTGAGQLMAGGGTFTITVNGESCHAGLPHTGADALTAGAAIVSSLQTIVSRNNDPMKPLVVSVGTFKAGSRYNVVAGSARMEGTVRTFDRALLHDIGGSVACVAGNVAKAHRCTADVQYSCTCESLITDAKATDCVKEAAAKVAPADMLLAAAPGMGSEDFAYFSVYVPSAFAAIGGGGGYPQHNERFVFDERALLTGTALYAQFALTYLNG